MEAPGDLRALADEVKANRVFLQQLQFALGVTVNPPVRTLKDLSEELLPGIVKGLARPDDYEIPWRLRITKLLGSETRETLTSDKVEEALDSSCESPRTWNKTRYAGLVVIERARKRGLWVGPNPFAELETRDLPTRLVLVPTRAEMRHIFEVARPDRGALFASAFYTGRRKGELRYWKREHLNLPRKLYHVLGSGERDQQKNGQQQRGLPLHDELVPWLEKQLASHSAQWVFPAPDGKSQMPDHTDVAKQFRATVRDAGILEGYDHKCRRCKREPERHSSCDERWCDSCGMKLWAVAIPRHLTFHDLRHIATTMYQEAGVPRPLVKKLIGHKARVDITDLYTHHTEAYMRAQMNKLTLCRPAQGESEGPFGQTPDLRTSNPKVGCSTHPGRTQLPSTPRLRTPKEIAERLGVGRETIYRLVERGQLQAVRVGSLLRFRDEDVEAYLRGDR